MVKITEVAITLCICIMFASADIGYISAKTKPSIPPIEQWQLKKEWEWILGAKTSTGKTIKLKIGTHRLYQKPNSTLRGAILTLFNSDKAILKGWWKKPFDKIDKNSWDDHYCSPDSDVQVVLLIDKNDIIWSKKGCQPIFNLIMDNGKIKGFQVTIRQKNGKKYTHSFLLNNQ